MPAAGQIDREFTEIADRCDVKREDANDWLRNWCRTQDWRGQSAVVFLDPYGMAVEWQTIEAIARTKAIDLWVLFPLGIGPSRVLPNEDSASRSGGCAPALAAASGGVRKFDERSVPR